MDLLTGIHSKRAIREFSTEPVPQDIVIEILESGRHAQSSKNSQPWQFVVVQKRETLQALSECGDYAGHLAGASFAVAIVPAVPVEGFWLPFDIGQAAAYLQLAAWHKGVGSCIAAMWEPERAASILRLPEGRGVDVVISFGYPAKAINLEAIMAKASRKPLEEVVRWESWD